MSLKLRILVVLVASSLAIGLNADSTRPSDPHVVLETQFGLIHLTVFDREAPITSANFLRYVDEGRFADASFYRVVRLDNQPDNAIKIEGIKFEAATRLEEAKMQAATKKEEAQMIADLQVKQAELDVSNAEKGQENDFDREKLSADVTLRREEMDLKERLANQEFSLKMAKSDGVVEKDGKPHSASSELAALLTTLTQHMTAPKRIIRDEETGELIGVENVPSETLN